MLLVEPEGGGSRRTAADSKTVQFIQGKEIDSLIGDHILRWEKCEDVKQVEGRLVQAQGIPYAGHFCFLLHICGSL